MDWKPDVCIYHFPCDDGFAAAWVVHRKWPEGVDYFGTNYGQPGPLLNDEIGIEDKNVLIADFSFKPDVLSDMGKAARSIVVLDHHKTAEADLAGFNKIVGASHDNVQHCLDRVAGPDQNILVEFDQQRSGASLAWRFCFPGDRKPRLIAHIEDRDLWKFEKEHTRCLSLLLRSYPYDFDVWTDLMNAFDDIGGSRGNVLAEAHAIERFYDRKLAEMLPTATLKSIGKWDGVPVANAPYAFASDLAHELLKAHPEAPFAAVVYESYGGRSYSLRSEDSRQDVSEVARQFGGGGHRNAAGFRVPA